MHEFLSNLANRQTDRQTRAKTCTSFVGGKKSVNVWHISHYVRNCLTQSTLIFFSWRTRVNFFTDLMSYVKGNVPVIGLMDRRKLAASIKFPNTIFMYKTGKNGQTCECFRQYRQAGVTGRCAGLQTDRVEYGVNWANISCN